MKNIITLSGWGFGPNCLKNFWPDSINLTCEEVFKTQSISPLTIIKETADSFNNEPYLIVAWSMGGLLALDFCYFDPENKASLLLLSPTHNFKYLNNKNIQELSDLISNLSIDKSKALSHFYMKLLSTSKISRSETLSAINKFKEESQDFDTNSLIRGLKYLQTKDLSDVISMIRNPCLIFHGDQDNLIPVSHSKLIKDQLVNSSLYTISGATHLLPYENKNQILETLEKHAFFSC